MYTVLNIDRYHMISSAIRKIEEGKQFVRTFWKFYSACGVNICSVNLDCETTFLTLLTNVRDTIHADSLALFELNIEILLADVTKPEKSNILTLT